MEIERRPKRRRITNHATHARYVQPVQVGSSFGDSYAPVITGPPVRVHSVPFTNDISTALPRIESRVQLDQVGSSLGDSDALVIADPPDRVDSIPSANDISTELRRIESRIQPDQVGSSFRDSETLVIADSPVRVDLIPSAKDISTELRRIESPYSRRNALEALNQLQEWFTSDNIESSQIVLENFYCYGGIARVLDFMEANMDDWDCVVGTAAALADFLSFRWNALEQNRNAATEMAKMIVRRNGIQLLLRANREHESMRKITSDTKHIWIALGRTMNGEETRGMINKKQKLCILKDASDCIYHLEEIGSSHGNNTTWTSDVLQVVLYTIANTIKDASIGKGDLKRMDIVVLCLRIMNRNDDWNRNDAVVTYALGILSICTKQKIIVTKNEFEQFLPMLIYCIRNFCQHIQIRSFVLMLLESACETVHQNITKSTGVFEYISVLLKSEGLSTEMKEKLRVMMGKIRN